MIAMVMLLATPAWSQVDHERARQYFAEVRVLCEKDAGRLWGVSLCGPIVIADPVTHTTAANQPLPDATPPATLGFANSAVEWGGTRWSTLSWPLLPKDDNAKDVRDRLILHELFHRIQPQIGLFFPQEPQNDHLDTLDGRFWIQLEWRALVAALNASAPDRRAAVADALAFRAARFRIFPAAAENERRLEINEGLPEYTGIAVWAPTWADAAKAAVWRVNLEATRASFVRNFAYASGAAYGVLLEAAAPGWTRQFKSSDDLAGLLARAMNVHAAADAEAAAERYAGATLRQSEQTREREAQKRLAELRRSFIEGPVLTIPSGHSFSFKPEGTTPIPGIGTVYSTYRTTADWGTLEGDLVLVSADRTTLTVPAPSAPANGAVLTGNGWKLTLAEGWTVRAGTRAGDLAVVKKQP